MQDTSTVQRVGLGEQVRARLQARIMDRDLEPGARLNVDALAREMAVSTTPLREALAALVARGLVTVEPFVGFSVAPLPDADFLRDLYDTRLHIEPWLTAQAALRLTEGEAGLLRACLADMGAHVRRGPWQTHRTHAAADEAFHDLIAKASGNRPARQALAALNSQVHASRLYMADQQGAENTAREHEAILDAMVRHDAAGARAAMAEHLEGSRERLAP
ncbi:GntR family transcriptional regulator [Roseomonas populi]|uniref:GntR family transcriptional regulator n=1 Tax=Roseomonas populi TaxID=3121582 RepID=A0ABT1WZ10_9PROT|nr:GntR family transcriptional regulator [Roseomonas pecuniae]MCR0981059.1 GntR family transcriptional regulator [Roseomonas pecuniae]